MSKDKRPPRRVTEWLQVDEPPPVTERVQIWWTELSDLLGLLPVSLEILTPGERARALKTRSGIAQNEFILCRTLLRLLLGQALNMSPQRVELGISEHGKPMLLPDQEVWFNVAHSHGTLVLAFTRSGPVGVDVEWLNSAIDYMDVAESAFTTEEIQALQELAPFDRLEAFYRCWTRKEAVLKADGCGLTVPLSAFQVAFQNDSECVVYLPAHGCAPGAEYRVSELVLGPNYLAAVASQRAGGDLELFTMSTKAAHQLLLQRKN